MYSWLKQTYPCLRFTAENKSYFDTAFVLNYLLYPCHILIVGFFSYYKWRSLKNKKQYICIYTCEIEICIEENEDIIKWYRYITFHNRFLSTQNPKLRHVLVNTYTGEAFSHIDKIILSLLLRIANNVKF